MPAMANLPALPRTAEALPPHAEREIARRRREGEDPTIAPKVVLETPMWLDPRVAARRSRLTREFRDLWHGAPIVNSLDVANPLPAEGQGSRSQHGLLRYLDLDVIMALSKAWVESGAGEGAVEVEQIRIFEWMGYQNLLTAPYSELRASLQRLKWTSIAVGEAGGRPVPFKLIEGFSEEKEDGRGSPKLLKARLDPIWCNALRTVHDWQAVDLQAYAKLAREHRRMGLARVIYLYLVSHRNASDEFHVPLYSLRDRYAQRRFLPGPEKDAGQVAGRSVLRRSDPMDDEELLKRALKTLHETGVCELAPVSAARLSDASLRGRFVRPREPMVLVTQQRFISPGLWDGKPRVLGSPALPAPEAAAPPSTPSPVAGTAAARAHPGTGVGDPAQPGAARGQVGVPQGPVRIRLGTAAALAPHGRGLLAAQGGGPGGAAGGVVRRQAARQRAGSLRRPAAAGVGLAAPGLAGAAGLQEGKAVWAGAKQQFDKTLIRKSSQYPTSHRKAQRFRDHIPLGTVPSRRTRMVGTVDCGHKLPFLDGGGERDGGGWFHRSKRTVGDPE